MDKMGKELLKHGGPHSKKCGDSSNHLDQVGVTETKDLDQIRATETKECLNDAFVSCETILENEKEVENVLIYQKNGKTIACVPENQGVDEKALYVR